MKHKDRTLQKIETTLREVFDATRSPDPYRNKKKFQRKEKHKKKYE